jgi:nucleoside phosphorylase
VLLGIAAGVPGRVELGDVIVPDQILYYESQKLTETSEEGAPSWRKTYDPVRVAASVMPGVGGLMGQRNWVAVHADVVMASGEKVVASREFREKVCSAHRKTAALDMESYGVASAAERHGSRVTIIKSICDFADSSKNDDFQEFAAMASAATFRLLVANGAFRQAADE